MALIVTDDLAPADWIANSTLDWSRLIEFGPSGLWGRIRRSRHDERRIRHGARADGRAAAHALAVPR
ncbi:MAG TPA: hypothetical protein VFT67_00555 [Jatrophihabitantaceae bacterium]|nr:hypothetical protein [Jatrophihabitantaceae bacterium]